MVSLSQSAERAYQACSKSQGQVLVLENKTSSMLLPNRFSEPGDITQPETPLQLNTFALKLGSF